LDASHARSRWARSPEVAAENTPPVSASSGCRADAAEGFSDADAAESGSLILKSGKKRKQDQINADAAASRAFLRKTAYSRLYLGNLNYRHPQQAMFWRQCRLHQDNAQSNAE
jgi:hypothetical protein